MSSNTRRTFSKGLSYLVLVLLIIFLVCYIRFLNQPIIPNENGFYYIIKTGSPLQTLITELEERKFLRHPILFKLLAYYRDASRHVQAGEYYFPPKTTPNQLIDLLIAGKVVQHKITLIEGWTFTDVVEEVKQNKNFKHTLSSSAIKEFLNLPYKNYEGIFLPETYEFPYGMTDREFLVWAHQLLEKRLDNAWEHRQKNLPYRNAYDAVIVASLIEKETADPKERYLIASVIVNRLRQNMRLQIDPTVIYGLYHKFIPVLSKFDLKIDTAYNTYIHKGLPPTPISLPSSASLNAALHPANTNYLYFVLKHDGKHHFSASYREHLQAKQKYRDIQRYRQSFRG